jgi:hypothetical protein
MRKAVFGEPVTAEDVEALPADTGPTAFVRLCGVLIGRALAERFGHSVVPQITERIVVPDQAVDAEYVSPPIEGAPEASGLLGPGRTVFQFKYRDARAGGRTAALGSLRGQLRKDFARGGPACDRFVLMTNLHLAGAQPHKLRALLDGVPALAGKPIVVWGAAEIALRLNESPHLRHLFFSAGGLCTLDVAEEELKAAYETLGWPPFVGRAQERAAIEEFVRAPGARVIQVVGPRYIGKTRLVLEALKPYGANVLWATQPDGVSLDHFRDLDTSDEGTILVVDRCEPTSMPRILEAAGSRRRLKTIVVARDGVRPATGPGTLFVGPFGHEDTGRLIAELLPTAPWREQSWVRETAGGVPGLIVHVAALLAEARISTTSPSEEIHRKLGDLVEEKYLLPLDADARRALSIAALLPVLGVEGEPGKEADIVSRVLGLAPEVFGAQLHQLESLGLVRARGRFVEVTPPLLADRLAAQALREPERVLAELRLALAEGAFLRLLERFRDLPKARDVVERLLSPEGWFPNVEALVSSAEHMRILAPAAPGSALRCLERLLAPLPASDLQTTIAGDTRRTIVSTLEHLVLRSATFMGAARLLLALAEAENESWGNNATGVFVELFHWRHPEVAASYSDRLAVLQESARASVARRRALVARACAESCREVSIGLHDAVRVDLPERPFRPETEDAVREYAGAILDLLRRLLDDPDTEAREAAVDGLLACSCGFVRCSSTRGGLAELGHRTLTALDQLGRSAPDARRRAAVVSELELIVGDLSDQAEPVAAVTEALEASRRILAGLTEGDLQARLWRWAGPPSWQIQVWSGDESAEITKAVDALAIHLLHQPNAFDAHLDWLTGEQAEQRWPLFFALGREDGGRQLFPMLVQRPSGPEWPHAFSAYVAGWATVRRPEAEAALDDLVTSRPDLARGLLRATATLPADSSGTDRILRLVEAGVIPRRNAIGEVGALRWDDLTSEDFERLIRGLDDGTPEIRAALLWPFLRRLANQAALTPGARALAWSFLEATIATPRTRQGRDWDFLASKLGASEPKRLLSLVEVAIAKDRESRQSFTSHGGIPMSWRTLTTRARPDLVRLLLRAEMAPDAAPRVGWELERVLRPEEDADLLVDFARECGVEGARTVAGVLDASKAGFWKTARRLLAEWGDDEAVRHRLVVRVRSGAWGGAEAPIVIERLDEARRLLSDRDPKVARWAREVVELLEGWSRRAERDDREEWIWDYRLRRAELEKMVRSPESPQRLWAIGRLLEDAPRERVLELLTPEDILAALPRLPNLHEDTRRKWTAYARHLVER